MSLLLDDLIQQSRADAAAYEEFLHKAAALARQLVAKEPTDNVPAALHGNKEAIVIFNNLPKILADNAGGVATPSGTDSTDEDKLVALALQIDRTKQNSVSRTTRWRGRSRG